MALPGKAPAEIWDESDPIFALKFERHRGEWVLFAVDRMPDGETLGRGWVQSTSVEKKIKAVQLFEPLLVRMMEIQKAQRDELATSIENVKPILDAFRDSEEEGE